VLDLEMIDSSPVHLRIIAFDIRQVEPFAVRVSVRARSRSLRFQEKHASTIHECLAHSVCPSGCL